MAVENIAGIGLKIELRAIEVKSGPVWFYSSDVINWKVTPYDMETHKQIFEVIEPGKPFDLKITFPRKSKFQIRYMEGNKEWTRVAEVN